MTSDQRGPSVPNVLLWVHSGEALGHNSRITTIAEELAAAGLNVSLLFHGENDDRMLPFSSETYGRCARLDSLATNTRTSPVGDESAVIEAGLNFVNQSGPFDALVTEFWPFSRRIYDGFLVALIDRMREQKSELKLYSVVRDIATSSMASPHGGMSAVLERDPRGWAAANLAGVFIASDGRIEATSIPDSLRDFAEFVGYVARRPDTTPSPTKRDKVLATAGGSLWYWAEPEDATRYFGPFLQAAKHPPLALAQLEWHLLIPPNCTPTDWSNLSRMADEVTRTTVRLRRGFIPNSQFRKLVSESQVVLSRGGMNTILDCFVMGTPVVVFDPTCNLERCTRSKAFLKSNVIQKYFPEGTMDSGELARALVTSIELKHSQQGRAASLNMNGARKIADRVSADTRAGRAGPR